MTTTLKQQIDTLTKSYLDSMENLGASVSLIVAHPELNFVLCAGHKMKQLHKLNPLESMLCTLLNTTDHLKELDQIVIAIMTNKVAGRALAQEKEKKNDLEDSCHD